MVEDNERDAPPELNAPRGDVPTDQSVSQAQRRSEPVLPPGTVVGRFIVHRTLGMGGAGVVYAAHDPELDRTIALKVLRSEPADRPDAQARFLREAQALARLSHPNVIAVYDVGTAEGRTFIAMEYISGHTFADWVARSRPSWQQILAVLVKAGRGLAASHAAGLVHRDFKPANMLVGADGRVVVTDFGLARAAADAEHSSVKSPARASALARSITMTGAVQGTPAYMAPEQHDGMPGDARADQFSFCVTLHEALFGQHPFLPPRARCTSALTREATPRAPSAERRVPAWLGRAVQGGLHTRPEDRHPNMDSLLAALGRVPFLRRRRTQLGIMAAPMVVAGGIGLGVAALTAPPEESCSGGRQQLSTVWNGLVVGRVRVAFAATGRPHAQASADRVAAQVETHLSAWADMHRATCLATLRGEQSPDLLDRRMTCLGRRLARVGALLDLFGHRTDERLVDDAVQLVASLEPLATCMDSTALLAGTAPPADPFRRARLTDLERQTDGAELERVAGRPQVAAASARAVLDAEREVHHAPLAAEARRVLGRSLEELGRPAEAREALIRAHGEAQRADDIRLAAHLLIDLVHVVGVRQERHGEAHLLGQLAEDALERSELRGDDAMRARMLEALGSLANDEGQIDRAIELQTEVLAIRRRSSAPAVDVASAESRLGTALSSKGRGREARAHYREALAIRRRVLGDNHPLTAMTHGNLGANVMEVEGDAAEARRHFLAQLAVFERIPMHLGYPSILSNLGTLEASVGNHEKAREYHERALNTRRATLGQEHPHVANSLYNLGEVYALAGDVAKALSFHRQALAIREKTLGKEHPTSAYTLAAVGDDLRKSGHPRRALTYLEQALATLRPRLGKNLMVGYALAYHGMALLDLGRRFDAIPSLEQALEIIPPTLQTHAGAAFALARALDPDGPTSKRTRTLAEQARTIFATVGAAQQRDRVAAYLSKGR